MPDPVQTSRSLSHIICRHHDSLNRGRKTRRRTPSVGEKPTRTPSDQASQSDGAPLSELVTGPPPPALPDKPLVPDEYPWAREVRRIRYHHQEVIRRHWRMSDGERCYTCKTPYPCSEVEQSEQQMLRAGLIDPGPPWPPTGS